MSKNINPICNIINKISTMILLFLIIISIYNAFNVSYGLIANNRDSLINDIKNTINRDLEQKKYKNILTNKPVIEILPDANNVYFLTTIYSQFKNRKFDFGVSNIHSEIAIIVLDKKNDYLLNQEFIQYKTFQYKFLKKSNYLLNTLLKA